MSPGSAGSLPDGFRIAVVGAGAIGGDDTELEADLVARAVAPTVVVVAE